MTRIRTVVVDDEPLARERIISLLQKEPDIELAGEAACGEDAVETIDRVKPDLIFLDVQMPDRDGFEVLSSIAQDRAPVIVFVTAYDEYAIRAFDVHAVDYLLKPFDTDRFQRTLKRVRDQIQSGLHLFDRIRALVQDARADVARPDRLVVRDAARIFFLTHDEIDWVESAGNYVTVHVGPRSHLIRETMANMERRLQDGPFVRIHRSTIVNVDRIKELQPDFNGDYAVVLRDGQRLSLSRNYRDKLQARLGRFHH